ncbi:Putative acetyltransferase EpsM [Arenibacter antarcticus]|uniref:NeuD/PglB/VioB family sugar acetyltransferase n=1 Tax=Arenibacter antarcticus TaxID=2040469 RepID=A0ABW5VFT5_9FLAO|nr:NeuD/PglB/VioB family sugar acetyltransferase [Arenibacter sp. H213]
MNLKKHIALIGYSGHAYVCLETATLLGYEVIGYHDFNKLDGNPYKLQYLGPEEQFEQHKGMLFGSIGNNNIRENVFKTISTIKTDMFISLLHPSAIISKTVSVGTNVLISAGAIVNALSTIETGVIINTGAIVEHEANIKSFAHIGPGAVLAGNVTVGERSFIGAGAVVKQGITIGDDVVVGAGAVVIKDVPDNQTVIGNPAKQLVK